MWKNQLTTHSFDKRYHQSQKYTHPSAIATHNFNRPFLQNFTKLKFCDNLFENGLLFGFSSQYGRIRR